MRRLPLLLVLLALALGLGALPRSIVSRTALNPDFVHFESGHVHPLALTPGGGLLLAVNTPDNRLAVFDVTGAVPVKIADIPVGLEPVSVAALDDSTAWVVNHLSDDVSIVNLNTFHTRATLRVGDEPADVVFEGNRAWVSVSQEDRVKVYDTATLAPALAPILIQSRMPRALARSADGAFVYVAGFHAGNRTSVLSFTEAQDSLPPPSPPMAAGLPPAPDVGLIIQRQGNDWRDESGKLWNSKVKYAIHDADLTEIETATGTVSRTFGGLGTVNLGLATAADGSVALTATEARNLIRFEPNLRGHNVDTRVAFVSAAGVSQVKELNPHVNYAVPTGTPAERDSAVGIPNGVAFAADGVCYVTSLSSDRLAVLDPGAGANVVRARVPTVAGPTGVLVDDARGRVYVLGRFQGELQTLSTTSLAEVGRARLGFDPTPDEIVNGRRFFYGGFTSGHGEHACATCHVFGDFDNLAWDLGDPTGSMDPPPPGMIDPQLEGFHPMKGPMTTQTLRGLPGTFRLHWRADRENLAAFNPAFVGLLGRTTPLPDSQMAAFSDFTLALVNPPNPRQHLDRRMPDAPAGQPSALRGQNAYFNTPLDGPFRCNDCHAATNFGPGTNGQVINDAALLEDQDMKIPQLRNLYRKTGFIDGNGQTSKRGFGFTHDGAVDDLVDFLRLPVFNFAAGPAGDPARRDMEAFMLAFDTGMAPAVGYQLTFSGANNSDPLAIARLDTLAGQAALNYCDLIAKGREGGQPRGWSYQGGGQWKPDRNAELSLTTAQLRTLGGPGTEVTVTGVPKGSGTRMGIDRDRDTHLDGDELDAGSDPGNPLSTPLNTGVIPGGEREGFAFRSVVPNPFREWAEVRFVLQKSSRVDLRVYDLLGREVRRVVGGAMFVPGAHALRWDGLGQDGARAGAGVYFIRLRTDFGEKTRAVVRIP